MMEQTHMCHTHGDIIFIASHNHMIITNRATRLYDTRDTTLMRTLNVITKWEERIRT